MAHKKGFWMTPVQFKKLSVKGKNKHKQFLKMMQKLNKGRCWCVYSDDGSHKLKDKNDEKLFSCSTMQIRGGKYAKIGF